MREQLLLINFKDKKQLKGIQMTAFLLKIKIRMVEKEDFLQPLGAIVGVEGIEGSKENYSGEDPEKEMMVFVGVSDSKLQRLLGEMRKNGIKKVDYKAVLTPTNVYWNTLRLYQELSKEHEAMQKGRIVREAQTEGE